MNRRHKPFVLSQARILPPTSSMRVLSRHRIQLNYHFGPEAFNRRNLFATTSKRIHDDRVYIHLERECGEIKKAVIAAGTIRRLKKFFLDGSVPDLLGRRMCFASIGRNGHLRLRVLSP